MKKMDASSLIAVKLLFDIPSRSMVFGIGNFGSIVSQPGIWYQEQLKEVYTTGTTTSVDGTAIARTYDITKQSV